MPQTQEQKQDGLPIQEGEQERKERTQREMAEREKSNNPATAKYRQYDQIDQPGLDPGNQPDPDSKLYKATRLDLEDITGNPGHRGINPDAPANSINPPTDPKTGRLESINEPPGSEPENSRRHVQHTATDPGTPKAGDDESDGDELPTPAELERMTRADLDELAEKRNVDISDASNKQDVIDALRKDARKRKRA